MTAVEAPAGGRRALRSISARSALLALAAIAALAALLRAALGPGQVNYDSLYALVWGRELAHGHAPDYSGGVLPPTPHPLSTLTGALLSPLGTHADRGLLVLAYLALGAVGVLAFALGRELTSNLGGVVAAVLVLTRDTLLFNGALAYFDVIFLALVMGALLIEMRRPRAGVPVLALLAIAGLWRAEAWVLAGAYAVYLMWASRGQPRSYAPLAWAAAAPAVWVVLDLIITGRPLYSLMYTRGAATTLGRDTGLSAALVDLPRTLGQVVRPSIAVGALVGCGIGLVVFPRRLLMAVAALVLFGAAVAFEVAAGTPGNPRYLLVPATICVLLCTLALLGWQRLPAGHSMRRPWQVAAVAVALLALVKAPGEATRLGEMSDRVAFQHAAGRSALQAVSRSGCRSLAVSGTHVVPLLAVAHDLPAGRFPVIKRHPPARSGYLVATTGATVRGFLLVPRIARPAPGARVAATVGDWRVYGRCPARD